MHSLVASSLSFHISMCQVVLQSNDDKFFLLASRHLSLVMNSSDAFDAFELQACLQRCLESDVLRIMFQCDVLFIYFIFCLCVGAVSSSCFPSGC